MDPLTFRHSFGRSLIHSNTALDRGSRRMHAGCRGAMNFMGRTNLQKDFSSPLHTSSIFCIPNKITELESPLLLPSLTQPCLDSFKVLGRSQLSGHVHISGAKNSALAVLAGSLCCSSEEICIRNVPRLVDVSRMLQVLQSLGVIAHRCGNDIFVDARNISLSEPCEQTIQKLRAGFFVIGPLIARHGEAILALPGGCAIGLRPVDLHLRGLKALGAKVEVRKGKVHAWAGEHRKRLKGGSFCMDFPSVGATETLMMAACLAEGQTVLTNAAQEPEVLDLARFLIACGAKIQGAGTRTIIIDGSSKLHGADFTIIPDRIEAGTFLIAAAITHSSLTISPIIVNHLTEVMRKLAIVGCKFEQSKPSTLQINASLSLRNLKVATGPYPSFPTDLQPQIMSLAATCNGQSVIKETVFEKRMSHVEELRKLGAHINVLQNKAVIQGTSLLSGAQVKANDLRAGSALILASMAAEGVSIIEGASHVDRGYEMFDEKLKMLGASIERL